MTDFHVRVPASTSNLGPGFDCLGLAVDRYLRLRWSDQGQGTVHTGFRPPAGFGNLLDRSRAELGLPDAGRLDIDSEIPVGRGLGSSAALRIALAALHAHLLGDPPDRRQILQRIAEQEGHPDNATPALMGGLVAASLGPDGVGWSALEISPAVGLAFAAPAQPLSTDRAREVLPDQVPLQAAIRTVGRIARLLPALAAGDGDGIRAGLVDELHVPARVALIPGAGSVQAAATDAGAWGCTISGAGSGMIALGPVDRIESVRSAMADAFSAAARTTAGTAEGDRPSFVLQVDRQGALWGSEPQEP